MVSVVNSGQALSKIQQERIFNRFYQTQDIIEDVNMGPGTGIGLSIVTDIVKLHHGRIELRSNKDEGTIFTVFLPKSDTHINENERYTKRSKR